ncbi:hypothetical protein CAPTEDRAFT_226518 [Capitella teleta]|uniref:CAP-Gly domain-containing protein n=1 Tax=Capitella teleta TaxID=283909 RepID=R7V3Q2_CAPTE|nr:hypothetical protein CAPTEDRAFT_226518 [Capitella teleta]|eukprot:ELU10435.1 hypothetical protein CAPTEDRAFT_226518 [Capitella teleta]
MRRKAKKENSYQKNWMKIYIFKRSLAKILSCVTCKQPRECGGFFWTQDSSDETIINSSANESYSNEFDTATETAQQANAKSAEAAAAKKKPVSSASPTETRLSRVAKEKGLNVKASPLVTQRNNRRGESGSESEDSFSLNFSETPSDASDYENRIKLLNDELHRRKVEAEDLKKEQKKRRRDRLKEKEAALSQQIAVGLAPQAYDDYIIQVKHEMDGDVTPVRVKPQRLESLRQPDVTVLADASSILSPDHLPRSISQGQTTTSTPKESVSHKDTVSEEEIPIDAAASDNSESQALDFRLKLDETPQVEEKAAHTARSIPEIPESEAATPREPSVSTRSEHFTDDFESEKSERSESSSQSYTSSSQQRSRSTSATSTETESDRRTEVSSSTKVSVHTEEDISEHLSAASEDEASGIVFDLNTTEQSKPTDKEDQLQDFTIGDRVTVGGVQAGTLMFKGSTMFMPGFWAGVALDKPEGRNNGSKDGVEYFKCPAMHGLFAPPDKIARLIEEVEEDDASSEHTITEDVPDHAPLKESDDEEDSEQISESKNSMTDDAATDSELERVISSAAAAVEGFELKDEETDGTVSIEEPFKDDLNNKEKEEEVEVKKSPPPVPKKPDQKLTDRAMYVNNTADNAVQNMLNEAISQMIKIRSKKAQTPPKEPKEEEKQEEKKEKREEKKVQNEEESGFRGGSNFMQSLDLEIPSERRKGNSDATALDFTGATPTVIKQDDLDRMYEELMTLTGDEDEYWEDDDEMGFGGNARKRPPAYQEKSPDNTGLNKAELRLDLRKLNEELIYAVPNQKEQLVPLIHNTAEVFWERRRYGEAWDSTVQPPQDFFDAAEDQGADMESRSKKVYKRMVFDLTAEVLRDLYKDEGHSEESFWPQFRTQRAWPVRERTPPTTLQALKPVLESRVLKVLHRADPAKEGAPSRRLKTWSSRKKKDHVDQILVQELRHEEPDWINYDDDELAVKMQLSDALFDSLLCETGQVISRIQQKRSNHR